MMIKYQKARIGFNLFNVVPNQNKRNSKWRQKQIQGQHWLLRHEQESASVHGVKTPKTTENIQE